MSLPLVLEQTSRWYYFAVPLAGLIIVPFAIAAVIDIFRRRGSKRLLIGLVGIILPLWFIFSNVGWQFRVDGDGIELRAPANPFEGAGQIAWRDLRAVRFTSRSTRGGSSNFVEFDGGSTTLELGALSGIPKSFWPALIEAVRANAPRAKLEGADNPEQWLKQADEESQVSWGSLVARRYVARDGHGKELK